MLGTIGAHWALLGCSGYFGEARLERWTLDLWGRVRGPGNFRPDPPHPLLQQYVYMYMYTTIYIYMYIRIFKI